MTIKIADALLAEAQAIAAKEKTTLNALVDEGLRKVVNDRRLRKPFKLKDGSFRGEGVTPEWANASWEEKLDIIYGYRR